MKLAHRFVDLKSRGSLIEHAFDQRELRKEIGLKYMNSSRQMIKSNITTKN